MVSTHVNDTGSRVSTFDLKVATHVRGQRADATLRVLESHGRLSAATHGWLRAKAQGSICPLAPGSRDKVTLRTETNYGFYLT